MKQTEKDSNQNLCESIKFKIWSFDTTKLILLPTILKTFSRCLNILSSCVYIYNQKKTRTDHENAVYIFIVIKLKKQTFE